MNQRINIELGSPAAEAFEARQFKVYTHRQLDKIEAIQNLPEDLRFDMRVVSQVLPFRVNEYVIDELIDWNNIRKRSTNPIFCR